MHWLFEIWRKQFEWDVSVLSEPWMYIPLLIPVSFFLSFMLVKWWVLSMPIWMPVWLIFQSLKQTRIVEWEPSGMKQESILTAAKDHYWDTLEPEKEMIILHLKAILQSR